MSEIDDIGRILKSQSSTLSRDERRKLRNRQQILIKQLIKSKLKEHLEPIMMKYDLDSDVRIYNDGDDGIKVDFVEYWSDVDGDNPIVSEPEIRKPSHIEEEPIVFADLYEKEPFLEHKLDWSPFMYGFTIDAKYHQGVNDAVKKTMARGETVYATLLIDDQKFDIKFDNPDVKTRKDRIMRMLYKNKQNNAGMYLQKVFPKTFNYIKREKEIYGGKHQVKIPEHLQGILSIYTTDTPMVFRMTYKHINN